MSPTSSLAARATEPFLTCEPVLAETAFQLQRVDVTLAMARLLDGYERTERDDPLGERLFRFGIVLALFGRSWLKAFRARAR